MLSGENLAIVLFCIGIAINIALSAMNAAGWRHPVFIRSLFGLAAVVFAIGMAWPLLKTVSPTATGIVNQVATNPFAWFVVLMFGIATSLWSPRSGRPPDRVSKTTTSPVFVKNISVYTNSPDAPAMFGGTAAAAFDTVTLFLDYSAYYTTAMSSADWTQCRRIKLASFDPFEKDMRYEAIVVSWTIDKDGKTVALKWGNDPNKDIIGGTEKYRARLVFAASGKEQYFYFMLVPCTPNGQMSVIILSEGDFSFRQECERE